VTHYAIANLRNVRMGAGIVEQARGWYDSAE
jgi:hypothetical protein